jgi:Putative metal-binding motif/FG-GAP repeat
MFAATPRVGAQCARPKASRARGLGRVVVLVAMVMSAACGAEPECWFDEDRDGVGSTQSGSCESGPGWVEQSGDCDDRHATISPQATETCNGRDDDCDGEVDEAGAEGETFLYADVDQDGTGGPTATWACEGTTGLARNAGDCDDLDPTIFPGAPELCDGLDQDCDEEVDEDAVDMATWYADADGDGFGDPASTTLACEVPANYVSDASDCDDEYRNVSPLGTESCNLRDDDCDLLIDEDDAVDAVSCHQDRDRDGEGNAEVLITACICPEGWTSNALDCDDTDSSVSSGAGLEVCDGVDQDCDGLVDEDPIGVALLYPDADLDGYGVDGARSRQCPGAAGWSTSNRDCDDTDAAVYPGAGESWYDGVDQDCDGESDFDADRDGYELGTKAADDCDDSHAEVNPSASEQCGNSVDDNCDGATDGQPCAWQLDAIGFRLTGEAMSDGVGYAVAGGGDVNGDGLADLVVGAYNEASGGTEAGASYIFHGPLTAMLSASSAAAKVEGNKVGAHLGSSVAFVGDMNGDGLDDVLVGAPAEPAVSDGEEGAAYLMLSPLSGALSLAEAEARIQAPLRYGSMGKDLDGAGDIDGDGLNDLVIGAPGMDPDPYGDVGMAVVLLGPVTSDIRDLNDAYAQLIGTDVGEDAGNAVAGAGDLDGDGLADVVIGAHGASVAGMDRAGVVYVVSTPPAGPSDLSDATAILTGRAEWDLFGVKVVGPGDVDGDGLADLLVGAYFDSTGGTSAGAVYLLLGPFSGTVSANSAAAILVGSAESESLSEHVDSAGDVDGDGNIDLIVGSVNHKGVAGTRSGAAFLAFGPFSGTSAAVDLGFTMEGPASGDLAGVSVAGGGDIDGDGLPELLIGASGDSSTFSHAGALWVVPGSFW